MNVRESVIGGYRVPRISRWLYSREGWEVAAKAVVVLVVFVVSMVSLLLLSAWVAVPSVLLALVVAWRLLFLIHSRMGDGRSRVLRVRDRAFARFQDENDDARFSPDVWRRGEVLGLGRVGGSVPSSFDWRPLVGKVESDVFDVGGGPASSPSGGAVSAMVAYSPSEGLFSVVMECGGSVLGLSAEDALVEQRNALGRAFAERPPMFSTAVVSSVGSAADLSGYRSRVACEWDQSAAVSDEVVAAHMEAVAEVEGTGRDYRLFVSWFVPSSSPFLVDLVEERCAMEGWSAADESSALKAAADAVAAAAQELVPALSSALEVDGVRLLSEGEVASVGEGIMVPGLRREASSSWLGAMFPAHSLGDQEALVRADLRWGVRSFWWRDYPEQAVAQSHYEAMALPLARFGAAVEVVTHVFHFMDFEEALAFAGHALRHDRDVVREQEDKDAEYVDLSDADMALRMRRALDPRHGGAGGVRVSSLTTIVVPVSLRPGGQGVDVRALNKAERRVRAVAAGRNVNLEIVPGDDQVKAMYASLPGFGPGVVR